MSETADKRRRGRPALPPEEKKRRNVTFRLRDSFREEIERRAVANGRSMSEEIETILERFVPIADVITREFVNDLRSVLNTAKEEAENKSAIYEMARWSSGLAAKFAEYARLYANGIESRSATNVEIFKLLSKDGEITEEDRINMCNMLNEDLLKQINAADTSDEFLKLSDETLGRVLKIRKEIESAIKK